MTPDKDYLTYRRNQEFSSITLRLIKQVPVCKSLGVKIDQNLKWDDHIQMISKKVASGISAIKRVRNFVLHETLLTIYRALVQPHFNNCSAVWGNCNKGLSEKLQKLQNRAARIISFSNYDASLKELFQALNWRKLEQLRKVDLSILMYKTLNHETPEYLSSKFINRTDVTPYHLRNTVNKLALPLPRTEHFKKSFSYDGAALWNSLPDHLRQASSLTSFKSKIRSHNFQ